MSFRPADKNEIDDGFDKLMCQAHGCPNAWCVDMGSKLCSAHAWSDPRSWPEITDRLQVAKLTKKPQKIVDAMPRWSMSQIRMALEALKTVFKARSDPRQWARTLRDREAAGEPLSKLQRSMWRSVIKVEL